MDKKKIEEAVRLLLEGVGEDPAREGIKETPERVARMYEEILGKWITTEASILQRLLRSIKVR